MARKRHPPQRSLFDFLPEQAEQGETATPCETNTGDERHNHVGSHATRVLASRADNEKFANDTAPLTPLKPYGTAATDGASTTLSTDLPSLSPVRFASGEKLKAHHLLNAIRTLKTLEAEQRPASLDDRRSLSGFCGLGPIALGIFPNPATGQYKDTSWQTLGEQLKSLLTPEEYASVRRSTFCAFYTSDPVIAAIHSAIKRLGVPADGLVLEPGCGIGLFMRPGYRYLGIEQDSITARIARVLHPDADIRIEDYARTKLPPLDAVVGNVPFADIPFAHNGQSFSLHDGFLAKSVDALKPGGVLALVTSHYTLDKQNAGIREYLGDRADFLGAIRLPSDAFKAEGTSVVTDIVFLRKRTPGQPENHADYEWKQSGPAEVDGKFVPINRYFINHPEIVLGTLCGKGGLYGTDGYTVESNGDLAEQLQLAIGRLPQFKPLQVEAQNPKPPPVSGLGVLLEDARKADQVDVRVEPPRLVPPPPERHISEGSFFVHDARVHQVENGQSVPVVYGGSELWVSGGLVGRRMGHLIELRDMARRVLQSQNEGWPEPDRQAARRSLNYAYDAFKSAFGPINKTTLSETRDGGTTRRMPNLVKFREDPDAMLVMALEEYDEETGEAKKAPILLKDVVGKTPPVTHVATAEEGLLVSLDRTGGVDMQLIATLYGKPEPEVIAELGDLIYRDPESNRWETADAYLSGNVRTKLAAAEKAGVERNVAALTAVIPEDVLPGDIDANLGAPWIPVSDVQQFAAELFQVQPGSVTIAHMAKDAVWSVEGDWSAERAVAVTSDYGTSRASGLWLLDLALNMRTPVIYDPVPGDPDKRQVNQEQTLAAKEKQRAIKEQFKSWVFADPDRTERLVRTYNDAFNSLRPRQFEGSHLQFPGMSHAVSLRPHQKDVIWRCVSGGNTLVSHVVGAGKTYSAAAAAVKLKQTGLAKKVLVAVPNHLLEQFGREFQHLYPNAKLLIAGKDDFTKDRRKMLTAKIASGDWDAIVVTTLQLRADRHVPRVPGAVPPRADRGIRPVARRARDRQVFQGQS